MRSVAMDELGYTDRQAEPNLELVQEILGVVFESSFVFKLINQN